MCMVCSLRGGGGGGGGAWCSLRAGQSMNRPAHSSMIVCSVERASDTPRAKTWAVMSSSCFPKCWTMPTHPFYTLPIFTPRTTLPKPQSQSFSPQSDQHHPGPAPPPHLQHLVHQGLQVILTQTRPCKLAQHDLHVLPADDAWGQPHGANVQ